MRSVGLIAMVVSACSYSPPHGNPAGDAGDDPIDTPPPITCGDLLCDPHATCDPNGPSCSCNTGFTGDGMTCADVDECATANGGCAAECANTEGSFECYTPATCAEIKARFPAAVDESFKLYVGADPAKPWTAFCANMATTPREYLTLTGDNFGQYTSGGASPGTSVRTTFAKVRLDPATLAIEISDRKFAATTGALTHSNNTAVTAMPYAVAMDCRGMQSSAGSASIDLRNTPFVLGPASTFTRLGNQASSSLNLSSGNQVAQLTGGGFCGWLAPTGTPSDPFNNNAANATLPVAYDP
jgi:hypothetical protein